MCNWDKIELIANLVGAIANAVAVVLAWKSIRVTVKEQNRIRQDEKDKNITSQKTVWYNQIVLEDVMTQLTQVLELLDRKVNEQFSNVPLSDDAGENLYRTIEMEFQIMTEKLMVIKIFSGELYHKCKLPLDLILDYYAELVEAMMNRESNISNIVSNIQNCKIEIMEYLYGYGKDLVGV